MKKINRSVYQSASQSASQCASQCVRQFLNQIRASYGAMSFVNRGLTFAFILTILGVTPLFFVIPHLYQQSFLELFVILFLLFWILNGSGLFKKLPRLELSVQLYTSYAVYFYMTDIWVRLILYASPFHFIDSDLSVFARTVGFSLPAVMNFVYQWPWLAHFTWIVYGSLNYELMLVPLVLALLGNRRAYEVFLGALIIASFVGGLLYFFFPTTDPSSVYHDPHFILAQIQKVTIVHDIHHHIYLQFSSLAVVGFPSFHVMWALLMSLAFLEYRKAFVFILIWNTLIVLSTMGTGWHYLGDVLGGLILGFGAFWGMSVLQTRFGRSYPTPAWIDQEKEEDIVLDKPRGFPWMKVLNAALIISLIAGTSLILVQYLFG